MRGFSTETVSRREWLGLSAALAATALTAGAAIAGLTRSATPAPAQVPTVNQVVTPAATIRSEPVEPGG